MSDITMELRNILDDHFEQVLLSNDDKGRDEADEMSIERILALIGTKVNEDEKTIYISVNSHNIKHNLNHKDDPDFEMKPVLRAQAGKSGKAVYGNRIKVPGGEFVYNDGDKAILKCGARVVYMTDGEVIVE